MNDIAIQFDNVGKLYKLGLIGTGSLVHDLNRWWKTSILRQEDPYLKIGETNDRSKKGSSDYVWALKDITFDVKQGDVVGIIGKNGAGKSTLLKLLSRVTSPTTGAIRAKGRIASLLEVGTGFHPELTGRENIYMNGSIMGMTRHEIDRKLDEIVDFAGVERYIDTPVKRYSSGMTVRLGFAVAAFLEPEILVVDEVLAVGDIEFQKKAIGKMQDVSKGEGRTVLFVSHNMGAVKSLCTSGIVLKNGCIEYMGTSNECVDYYTGNNITELVSHTIIDTQKHRPQRAHFMKEIEILEVKLLDSPQEIGNDQPINLEIKLKRNNHKTKLCQFSVIFLDDSDTQIAEFITNPINVPQDREIFYTRIKVMNHGFTKRAFNIRLIAGLKDFAMGSKNYDIVDNVLSFEVTYYNKNEKKEFLQWERNWGAILHNKTNTIVELIE